MGYDTCIAGWLAGWGVFLMIMMMMVMVMEVLTNRCSSIARYEMKNTDGYPRGLVQKRTFVTNNLDPLNPLLAYSSFFQVKILARYNLGWLA